MSTQTLNIGSDENFKTVFDAIQDMVYIISPDMLVSYININGARMFGAEIDQVVGKHLVELFPQDESELQIARIRTIMETGEAYSGEGLYPFPDGERWLSTRLVPVKDTHGGITAVLGSSQDITEKKQAEIVLRESHEKLEFMAEERTRELQDANNKFLQEIGEHKKTQAILRQTNAIFAALFRTLPDQCFRLAADGSVLNFLAGHATNLYREPQEFLGKQITGLLPPEIADKVTDAINQIRGGNPLVTMEYSLQVPAGEKFFESRMLPLPQDEIFVLIRDITERKLADESLRESLSFNRTILSESPLGMATYDEYGACTSANEAIATMVGGTNEQVVGQNIYKIKSWKESGLIENAQKTLADGIGRRKEIHVQTSFGKKLWLDCRFSRFVSNRQHQLLLIVDDIGERKKDEAERKKLEAQVQQAQKRESLGVLAGGIAHDFNNLLVSVLGNAEMALMDLSPESPIWSSIQDIKSAAVDLTELTHQMLAFSGKGKFVVKPIRLSSLVEEMIESAHITLPKQVELQLDLAHNLPPILGDADQIRQVIRNLITNASEACEQVDLGGITLRTGLTRLDGVKSKRYLFGELQEDCVFLEVADNGCGMNDETLQKMFDPFYSTKFTGRGLGLAAVQGIIRSHRGNIKVKSTPNQGTTVTVLFPHEQIESTDSIKNKSAEELFPTAGKVLLADDEQMVLATGKKMLERMGFNVLTAADGLEAIQQVHDHAQELLCIMIDLSMPNMDGIEALKEIRRVRHDLPVILCSGYNETEAKSRFEAHDLTNFIHKPFRYKSLVEKLKEVLR